MSTDIENCTTSDTEKWATPDPVWGVVSGLVPSWLRQRCLCLFMVCVAGCIHFTSQAVLNFTWIGHFKE